MVLILKQITVAGEVMPIELSPLTYTKQNHTTAI